jgi:hypothetical protein
VQYFFCIGLSGSLHSFPTNILPSSMTYLWHVLCFSSGPFGMPASHRLFFGFFTFSILTLSHALGLLFSGTFLFTSGFGEYFFDGCILPEFGIVSSSVMLCLHFPRNSCEGHVVCPGIPLIAAIGLSRADRNRSPIVVAFLSTLT